MEKWLNLLDTTSQSGKSVSTIIGGAIADAIQGLQIGGTSTGHTFNSVEFFVVPGSSGVTVNVGDLPEDSSTTPTLTKVITIQTITVDNLHT
jgi:hypothetical protein